MLHGKKILIGVTGCIAAYKVCIIINKLKKKGVIPRVMMTKAATRFVGPLTFQSLSNHPVYLDLFDVIDKTTIEHIAIADWGDAVLIVPATANTISKIALGIADNLLTTTICALQKKIPVIIAPAMNCHMWENQIIQQNIAKLEQIIEEGSKKYHFINPEHGKLACGYEGKGALADPQIIVDKIEELL